MVENLRLVGPRTLTPSDSDIAANFTITASDSSTWCTDNTQGCDDKSMVYYANNTSYGAYYNWYTATAGTGTYSMTSGETTLSICPKQWRLSSGNTTGQMYSLLQLYGTDIADIPVSIVGAGRRVGGEVQDSSSRYFFWTRAASLGAGGSVRTAERVYGDLGSTALRGHEYRNYGYSIRCFAYNG